jgi:predicted DNA-binding transcriptional regulator YafY
MSISDRIQWLHSRIADGRYPNAGHLAERFGISYRQAQSDVDNLRTSLGAPLAYCAKHRGFYYTSAFSLPAYTTNANAEDYIEAVTGRDDHAAEQEILQMQIPYTATLRLQSKLTRLELRRFIVGEENKTDVRCEFHSIETFLGVLFSLEEPVEVLEPAWLRERLVASAQRVLQNHA